MRKESKKYIAKMCQLGIVDVGSFEVLSDHGDHPQKTMLLLMNPQKNAQRLCHNYHLCLGSG